MISKADNLQNGVKMDSRESMMKTQEIDILDLLATVLFHWRGLILSLLLGTIIFAGIGVANAMQRSAELAQEGQALPKQQVSAEQRKEELLNKLTEAELINVENVLLYEQQYATRVEYQQNSFFMQSDPYHMNVADLIFQINADDLEKAYNIKEVYENILRSIELRSIITEATKSAGVDDFLSLINYGDVKTDGSNVIHVYIKHSDIDTCRKLASIVVNYISNKRDNLGQLVGEHDIVLIDESYGELVDVDIMNQQRNLQTDISNLKTAASKLIKDFSDEEKEYYAILKNEERDETIENTEAAIEEDLTTNPVEDSPKMINIKYIIMGAVLFAFIYAFYICLQSITNNKVKVKDDLQDVFGISQLGIIYKDPQNRRLFSFVDYWVMRLYYRNRRKFDKKDSLEYTKVAIQMAVRKNALNQIFFVGCGMTEETKRLSHLLKDELKENNIEVEIADNILYNAQSMKKMENAKAVVLVETVGKTMHQEILQEIQILNRQNIIILGGIIVE